MKGRVRKDEEVRQKEGNEMEGKGMGGATTTTFLYIFILLR